jgi:hypothetical protein
MTELNMETHRGPGRPPKQTAPATGTDIVSVACKIPSGWMLQLHAPQTFTAVTPVGNHEVTQYFPIEEDANGNPASFRLNGPAHPQNEGPRCRVVLGFAITRGVPRDLWERWCVQNKTLPAFKNGMIHEYKDNDRGSLKEYREQRTGMERINPANPPRLSNRFKVTTSDDQKAPIQYVEED